MQALTPTTHPTLYLSGPMTIAGPGFNTTVFHAAAARLCSLGFTVLNPAESFGGDTSLSYNTYMREDIQMVARADAVALLPGWEASKGVLIETTVAGFLGLPLVCATTLLPVSRETPRVAVEDAPTPVPRQVCDKVAFAGFARAGKSEAAEVLVSAGWQMSAFGNIIKRRLKYAPPEHLGRVMAWLWENEPGITPALLQEVYDGFRRVKQGFIDPFTEDDGEKVALRAILERYGEAFYGEVFTDYYEELPIRAVNTRLVRCREAEEWKKRGGIIIAITRPDTGPATDWEAARFEELRAGGYVDHIIVNDGTTKHLHAKVREAVGLPPHDWHVGQTVRFDVPETHYSSPNFRNGWLYTIAEIQPAAERNFALVLEECPGEPTTDRFFHAIPPTRGVGGLT